MDSINQRFVAFLKHTGKSKSDLANQLGISPAVISHISSGRNKVALDVVQKILEHYPSISSNWLLMGVGEMYESGNSAKQLIMHQELQKLQKELAEVNNRLTVFQRNFKKLSDSISEL